MSDALIPLKRRDRWKQKAEKLVLPLRGGKALQRSNAGLSRSESPGPSSTPASNTGGDLRSEPTNPEHQNLEAPDTIQSHTMGFTPESQDRLSPEAAVLPSAPRNNANSPSLPILPSITSLLVVGSEGNQDTSSTVSDITTPCSQSTPAPSVNTAALRDLWSEALGKLSKEDQQAVRSLQVSRLPRA